MPKVRTPDNTARLYLFEKRNVAQITRMLGLGSRKSVYERIENPGNIKLKELGILAEKLTDEEIVTVVRAYE